MEEPLTNSLASQKPNHAHKEQFSRDNVEEDFQKHNAKINLVICDYESGEKTTIKVRKGLPLEGVATLFPKEFPIEFDCREADCGICLFQDLSESFGLKSGLTEPTHAEMDYLKAMNCSQGERLGCQVRITGPAVLRCIPP